jgi:hypothetical protein
VHPRFEVGSCAANPIRQPSHAQTARTKIRRPLLACSCVKIAVKKIREKLRALKENATGGIGDKEEKFA